eukprot:6157811-Alexandrium_andersonii.AAC.1
MAIAKQCTMLAATSQLSVESLEVWKLQPAATHRIAQHTRQNHEPTTPQQPCKHCNYLRNRAPTHTPHPSTLN